MSSFFADSHCHLQMLPDPAPVLERARQAGVTRFLVPGTMLADSETAVSLAATHDCLAAVGIHPHEAKDFDPAREGEAFERLARSAGVVAIGEIGLDFYYDHSPRDRQIAVLEWMLGLARRLSLPVLLHNRESGSEMLAALSRVPPAEPPGVFHSFTEDADYGRRVLDLGYRISFSGMLTFRGAEKIRNAAAALPLESMLIETDSPFLAPAPHRGKTCEPAFLVETARALAVIKGVDVDAVADATTRSFQDLFARRAPTSD